MCGIKSEHFKLLVPLKLQHKSNMILNNGSESTPQTKDFNLWVTILITYFQVYQNNHGKLCTLWFLITLLYH